MGSVPFALSIHHFINSVGSDAGFASIIGLAILVLLYFAQARETASLRHHADDAAERIQQLEGRIAQLTGGEPKREAAAPEAGAAASGAEAAGAKAVAPEAEPVVSRPATARDGVPARAFPAVAGAIPAAPAGVGAPALTAATRLIPIPGSGAVRAAEPVGAAAAGARVGGGAPAAGAAPAPAGRAQAAGGGARGERVPAAAALASPPPSTVAGGANGLGRRGTTFPPPSARRPGAPRVQLPQQATNPPARRPPAGSGGPTPQGQGSTRRWFLWAALGVLAVVVVVALVLVLSSNSGHTKTATNSASTGAADSHRTAGTFKTSQVTVAVLNGTATSNLAHDIGQRLSAAGYQEGTIATATDQTHPTTIVAFLPGFKRDALAVAGTLKLKPNAVQAVDTSTQAVACPPPSSCKANVVVTVGSDLSNSQ